MAIQVRILITTGWGSGAVIGSSTILEFWNSGKLTDLDLSVDYMGAHFRFEHFTKYMLYLTEQTKTKRY